MTREDKFVSDVNDELRSNAKSNVVVNVNLLITQNKKLVQL